MGLAGLGRGTREFRWKGMAKATVLGSSQIQDSQRGRDMALIRQGATEQVTRLNMDAGMIRVITTPHKSFS
jgi:hypothetical protein